MSLYPSVVSVIHPILVDPERWQEIDRVLQEALALGGEERHAYLDETCADDAELRAEVEALLGFEAQADPFLAVPAVEVAEIGPDEALVVGGTVGPYRIESLLGRGGMGEVYRAIDERLGRSVAIKVVSATASPGLARRFAWEARMVSALNHPNILTVYDAGNEDGAPYLVTEYVEGEVLRARMATALGVEEAVEIARQVASALAAAHEAGIVHRDIKPENVIVRGDGLVKVLDFGIAKLVEGAWRDDAARSGADVVTEVNTLPGMMIGTASYMSPEQARGQEVDGRTDVWSLGVMLHEMVAGRKPFRGPTRMDVLVAVMSEEPDGLEELPEGVAEIVGPALGKLPDERYATVGEMAAALGRLKRRLRGGSTSEFEDGATGERSSTTAEDGARTDEQSEIRTNLPEGQEALIGRDREVRAVVEELWLTRLLTVVGPGGTGKTRLAREAGRALLHEFPDGVYFVELTAIRDPEAVVTAIAQVLGVREGASSSIHEAVADALRRRELLLVLDNFEHVIGAAPGIVRLLGEAPGVKMVVTSRERLRVSEEREYALAPLEVPPAEEEATDEALMRYGAVALFVERARAARSNFELNEKNDRAVAEICRRLEGLPLAIELAAARLRLLTPEALLGRLEKQLQLLAGGARDVPERQQTMRATIAWSYDLLEEDERTAFERLSVFSGGWTLEAADEVMDGDALDALEQLADKSLVAVEEHGGEMRSRMLETIRQFAAEKLRERGEEAAVRAAHAAWVVQFAEAGVREYEGPGAARWLAQLDREQENVRAAIEWSLGESDAPEAALRLSAAMAPFWFVRGRWGEGRSWLERALRGDRAPSVVRATALYWIGRMARAQGSYERARELVGESLALSREIGDRRGAARSLGELGLIAYLFEGDLEATESLSREALALHEAAGDEWGYAQSLGIFARIAETRGDTENLDAVLEQTLAIYRKLGDRRQVATQLYNLGNFAQRRGEYAKATELLEESLTLAREFDDRPLVARVTHFLGNVAGSQGDHARAATLRAKAARAYKAMGDRNMLAVLFEDVIPELLDRGLAERVGRLLGAMAALEASGALPPPSPADTAEMEFRASVLEILGDADAEAAMEKGRRLTLDQALKLAFSD